MENLKIENWNKPSNKKLKYWADVLLYTMPLYLSAIMSSPLDDVSKSWINLVITLVIVTFKAYTKFTVDENASNQ